MAGVCGDIGIYSPTPELGLVRERLRMGSAHSSRRREAALGLALIAVCCRTWEMVLRTERTWEIQHSGAG